MYHLSNAFNRLRRRVIVVGCGGTGGFAAEGLCRVLPANADLVLIDHDRVEEGNLRRQNFFSPELGGVKSEVLAERLARRYRRAVAYGTYPVAMADLNGADVIVGCVDNGPARRDIAERVKERRPVVWWVDAGNGENYGQILIGNLEMGYFDAKREVCDGLPLPTMQRPELLSQVSQPLSCADAPEQGPTINRVMAALVVEVVRRLIEGTCPWMQLLVDMQLGSLYPVMATPEAVAKIIGKKRVKIAPDSAR